jgi:hypothetical protein
MHPIQCSCGAIQGTIEGTGSHNRIKCYCADCRAFARYLGKSREALDEQGGTEVLQVAHSRLRFKQGVDRLAAIRLSDKGLVRWYAQCCNTPIGNTMTDPKMSFIGLIDTCLDKSRLEKDFGADIAVANVETALGNPKPKQRGIVGVIARFIWILITSRASGSYKKSPLYNAAGALRVEPKVLSAAERAQLVDAV